MRVGVTGAGGTIGRRLVPILGQAGHEVVALTRGEAEVPGADRTVTDWQRRPATWLASLGIDGVVHLAGAMTPTTWDEFDRAHLAPVRRLVELLPPATPVVLFSAANADADASNHYARSKGMAEDLVTRHFPSSWVLRPDLVLHPPERPSSFESAIVERPPGRPAVVLGPADRCVRPIAIDDVCAAVVSCLAGRVTPGTYALHGPERTTMSDLVQVLAVTAVSIPTPVLGLRPEHRSRRPDLPAPILEYFEAWDSATTPPPPAFPFPTPARSPLAAWRQLGGAGA